MSFVQGMISNLFLRIFIYSGGIILFGATFTRAAESFHASGVCYYTNFSRTGAASRSLTIPFDASVENEKVYLHGIFGGNQSVEWTYDGATSYYIVHSVDVYNPAPGLRDAATVIDDEFPQSADPILRTVWLGLCSAHFLEKPLDGPVLVPWGSKGLSGSFSFKWDIVHSEGSPRFPRKITFVASQQLWEKESTAIIEKSERRFNARDGFVGGIFEIKETTSVNGREYPSRFVLNHFRTGAGDGEILERSVVEVTNISTGSIGGFVPDVKNPIDVSDMRESTLATPGFGITYTMTNTAWLAKDDPKRLAMVQAAKPNYEKWRRGLSLKESDSSRLPRLGRRPVVIGILVTCGLILPMIYIVLRKMLVQKSKRKVNI
jgi:hypothetical protein